MFKAGQKVRIIKKNCSNDACMGYEGGCTGLIGTVREDYDLSYSIKKQVPIRFSAVYTNWCLFNESQIAVLGVPEEEIE